MKNQYSAYITVRINYESNRELDAEETNDLISEMDYSFTSRSKGIEITDTEICGINE